MDASYALLTADEQAFLLGLTQYIYFGFFVGLIAWAVGAVVGMGYDLLRGGN